MHSYKNLVAHFVQHSAQSPIDKSTENRKNLDELLYWIEQNIDSPISLNDLLLHSGLTLHELNKQFILQTKLSPLQFIKKFRQFKEAVELENKPAIDNTYALFDPSKNV